MPPLFHIVCAVERIALGLITGVIQVGRPGHISIHILGAESSIDDSSATHNFVLIISNHPCQEHLVYTLPLYGYFQTLKE